MSHMTGLQKCPNSFNNMSSQPDLKHYESQSPCLSETVMSYLLHILVIFAGFVDSSLVDFRFANLSIAYIKTDQVNLFQFSDQNYFFVLSPFHVKLVELSCSHFHIAFISGVPLFVLQRNYRFFFMFVFSTTLLCLYVFSFCWVYIKRIMVSEDISIWRAMIKTPASIVLIVYTFIAVWFVGGLTAFHLYLISTNQVRTYP